MSDWIDGEPTTDGLYAAEFSGANSSVISRHGGTNYLMCDGERSACQYTRPIIRHYPLPPPPPPPLKLPRRFRAKFSGKPVVGCEGSGEDLYRMFVHLGEDRWGFVKEDQLTELVWEDEEEDGAPHAT